MLLFLLLVNSEPLKCLKTPFVRQWVVYGPPSLCPYGVRPVRFDVLYRWLNFIPRALSFWNVCDNLLLEYAIFAHGGYTNGDLII